MVNITNWYERSPQIRDYLNAGIWRIELVHMTIDPAAKYSGRKMQVAERVRTLANHIDVVEVSLRDFTSGVSMSNIVLAGWKEDECVMNRANYLVQLGAATIIIDYALTVR